MRLGNRQHLNRKEVGQNYHLTFAYCSLDLINAFNISISSLFTLETVLKSEQEALSNVIAL